MNNNIGINAILVDDSYQARELLMLMLKEVAPFVNVIGDAGNVDDAMALIRSQQPDLVFLDIEMPEKSGFDLIEELVKQEMEIEVIFTTAYNQYAIQAFRLSAVDYLLKPIDERQLLESVEKFKKFKQLKHDARRFEHLVTNFKPQEEHILSIPVNYGYEYIPVNEIEFIEADRAYCSIHLENGSNKMMSRNMGYFENMLQSLQYFVKTHRSFIVNLNNVIAFVKKGEGGILTFKSGKTAEVSRSNRKTVLNYLKLVNPTLLSE
jgi:two-component system, LytTR family, response regulator